MKNTIKTLSILATIAHCSYAAQLAITGITTSTGSGSASSATLDNSDIITFDGADIILTSITVGATTYDRFEPWSATSFSAAPNEALEYMRDTGGEGSLIGTQITSYVDAFNGGRLNMGADNLLNTGAALQYTGDSLVIGDAAALTGSGFVFFDRGAGDSAIITLSGGETFTLNNGLYGLALDVTNNRDRYTPSTTTSSLFGTDIGGSGQDIVGTFVSLADFGLSVGDTIDGFSFTSSGLDLIDTSFVVDNTLDFNTLFIPEPSSVALLGLGGLALMLRRKRA